MVRERGFWLMIPGLLVVTSPLWWVGFPPSHDGVLHVYRVLEMRRMWRAGVFFPRWAPDLVYGLGYPLFHFHSPLFPWLGALGMTLGLDLESSVKVVLALLTLLGSAGVYRLARRWGIGEGGAMAAGLAYAFAPFRVRELYWQGDFPQYLGLCLLPWTLDTLHDYLRAGGWVRWWKAGLTYALLLLSHNITAMLSTGVLLGYGGLVLWAERPPRARGGKALGAMGLGIGLAAFFVIPALLDRSLVHLDRLLQGHFDFRKHFLGLDRLLSLVPIQDQSLGNPQEVLTLGGHQVVLALPGLLALRRPGRSRALALGAGIAVIGMIALMTPISRLLWEHAPLLAYAEFPWRWLGPAALPVALLIGLSIEEIHRARGLALAGILLAVILGAAPLLYPFGQFTVMRGATLADLQAFDRRAGLIGLTSVGELLPRWVTREIRGSPLEEDYREGREPVRLREEDLPSGSRMEILSLHPLDQRFRVDLPREATVSFWVFAFPGWNVQVDGQPVAVWPEEGTGRLRTRLPAGSHEVRLHFAGRWDWRLLELLSLGLWGAGLGRWLLARRRARPALLQPARLRGPALSTWETAIAGGLGMMLLIGKLMYVDPHTSWFRPRSDPNHPPGMSERADVDFGGRIRLLGYHLSSWVVEPGETLSLILWWRGLRPMETQYSVYVHGLEALPYYQLRFQSDHMHPGDMPTTAPPWRDERYIRDVHTLRIPADLAPGPYRLKVGLYEKDFPWKTVPVDSTGENGYMLPRILLVNRRMPPSARLSEPISFGRALRLVGVERPTRIPPGQPWKLWFYWEAQRPIDRSYTFFVHRLDESGAMRGQQDRPPYFDTSQWPVGMIVAVPVELDAIDQPGTYRLRIGWYEWPSMAHLLLPSGEPAYILPQAIEVEP
jgi:hypothetical protein